MSMIRALWSSGYPDKPEFKGGGRITGAASPRNETPIVPRSSVAGRALVAVIAIMTFLAALSTGGVALVLAAASDWQAQVVREATIQIRPVAGRDIEAEVYKAIEVARRVPGLAEIRPYSKAESARLLEPWLGKGISLDELPIPRIIVVKIASGQTPDLTALRKAVTEQVAGASLDDHRGFVAKMRAMAGVAATAGLAILALVLTATVLSVAFATRGAMAANRPIVEVLYFIGATSGFIANQFQRHFLVLGLKGGAVGGGAAILLFAIAEFVGDRYVGTAGFDQMSALFGSFAITAWGYAAILAQVGIVAGVAAICSRRVVASTLEALT